MIPVHRQRWAAYVILFHSYRFLMSTSSSSAILYSLSRSICYKKYLNAATTVVNLQFTIISGSTYTKLLHQVSDDLNRVYLMPIIQ